MSHFNALQINYSKFRINARTWVVVWACAIFLSGCATNSSNSKSETTSGTTSEANHGLSEGHSGASKGSAESSARAETGASEDKLTDSSTQNEEKSAESRANRSAKEKASWIAQKVPFKREPNRYSVEQLNMAAQVLRVANEDGDGQISEKNLFCSIPSNEGSRLMQALKTKLDQRIQKELQTPAPRRLNPQFWAKVKECKRLCSCRYYLDVLEGVSDSALKPKQREQKRSLVKITEAWSIGEARQCAEQAQWFCKSELLAELRTEATEIFGPKDDENLKANPTSSKRDNKN